MATVISRKSIKLILLSFLGIVGLIVYSQLIQSSTLLVAAAASMQPALKEITPLYQRSGANLKVNYNFGSSGALEQQIEQGAPIDIFISAANKQMNMLEMKNLIIPKTRKILLTNQLVLITSTTSSLKLTDFRQLVEPEIQRIAIGEPRSVPVGQYATEVFKNLGILDRVESKFVLANNVRAVLAAVETGAADAGIVYVSDAQSSDRVLVSAIADPKLHSPIIYSIAILKSSRLLESAEKYVDFLQNPLAQTVFKKYGFVIANP